MQVKMKNTHKNLKKVIIVFPGEIDVEETKARPGLRYVWRLLLC